MLAMFGWFSDARSLASRSNRAQAFRVFGELLRKNFYRDVAIELGIPSAVYLVHTPFADWLEDLIVGEARSGRE